MIREKVFVGTRRRNWISILGPLLMVIIISGSASGQKDPTVIAREALFEEYSALRNATGVDAILNCLSNHSRILVENQLDGTNGDISRFVLAKSFVKENLCPGVSGRDILPEEGDILRVFIIDREWAVLFVESSENEESKIVLVNEGRFSDMEWRFVLNEY